MHRLFNKLILNRKKRWTTEEILDPLVRWFEGTKEKMATKDKNNALQGPAITTNLPDCPACKRAVLLLRVFEFNKECGYRVWVAQCACGRTAPGPIASVRREWLSYVAPLTTLQGRWH
jgi:hypothetical protein